MLRNWNPNKIIAPILLWVMVAGVGPTSGALAADSAAGIRPITPLGETSSFRQRADIRPQDYFDVIGILNLMENDRVVIGDRELTLAPGVRTSRARQFNLVGAKLNRAGEVVVFDVISDEPN